MHFLISKIPMSKRHVISYNLTIGGIGILNIDENINTFSNINHVML